MDYYDISQSIAETLAKAGAPLTDDQRMLLAGAISPWLEKARDQLTSETKELVLALKEIKAAHEEAVNSEKPVNRFFHYDIVKKVNKAIRMVSF
jgi:gluconate kinase